MDDDTPYDNAAAEKINQLTASCVEGREQAQSRLFNHDISQAIMQGLNRLGERFVRVTIDYDPDTTESGEAVGLKVTRSGSVRPVIKSRNGTRTPTREECDDGELFNTLDLIGSPAFESAAVAEFEEMTAEGRKLKQRLDGE